jgi:hypothetical protein
MLRLEQGAFAKTEVLGGREPSPDYTLLGGSSLRRVTVNRAVPSDHQYLRRIVAKWLAMMGQAK